MIECAGHVPGCPQHGLQFGAHEVPERTMGPHFHVRHRALEVRPWCFLTAEGLRVEHDRKTEESWSECKYNVENKKQRKIKEHPGEIDRAFGSRQMWFGPREQVLSLQTAVGMSAWYQ